MKNKTRLKSRCLIVTLSVTVLLSTHAMLHAQQPPKPNPVRDGNRIFKVEIDSYKKLQRENLVSQLRDYSCGAAALATVAKFFWGDDFEEIHFIKFGLEVLTVEEFKDRVKNGLNMADLKNIATKAGYFSTVGKLTFEQLVKSKVPLVVGITVEKYKHFVVFRGWDGKNVYLADPIRGNIRISDELFKEQWQKQLVLVVAKPSGELPINPPLALTESEIRRGELHMNSIRKNYLFLPAYQ